MGKRVKDHENQAFIEGGEIPEGVSLKTKIICKCGRRAEFGYTNRVYSRAFGDTKKVIINNIPCYKCDHCNELVEYSGEYLRGVANYAIDNGYLEFDWNWIYTAENQKILIKEIVKYLEEVYKVKASIKEKTQIIIASRMINEGLDEVITSELTGLPESEIKKLKEDVPLNEVKNRLGDYLMIELQKWIKYGLSQNNDRIPLYAVLLLEEDELYHLEMKYKEQLNKRQSIDERIIFLTSEINEYEKKYGGKFKDLYDHLADDLELLDEFLEVYEWSEFEDELRQIHSEFN